MRRSLERRTHALPLESAIGVLAVYGAATSLLAYGSRDPIDMLLPAWAATAFNWAYLAAGTLLLTGILADRRRSFMFAMLVVCAALVVRTIAVWGIIGWAPDTVNAIVANGVFTWACRVRYLQARRGAIISTTGVATEPK